MNGQLASKEQAAVDFKVVVDPLDSFLSALENKIDREWPKRLPQQSGARELILLTLRTAVATYRSVRWLCADKPHDPHRRLEYSISVPPLNRTILDNLFTLLFVLEDLPTRCSWYFKADWRETRLDLIRHKEEYGQLPEWQDWLKRLEEYSDAGIAIAGLTPAEVASPQTIVRWPNVGAMVTYGVSSKAPLPPNRAFMKYLNDWFYADLSQQSHLAGSGLMKRAGALINDYRRNPRTEENLKRYRNSQVGQTLSLILALGSELETHFGFGLRERAQYVWVLMAPYIVVAKELFEKRYAASLGMNSGLFVL